MSEITATLTLLFSSTPGNRRPYTNYYECDGPDGRHFTSSNKATLLSRLRQVYGRVNLVIDDQRKPIHG